MKFFTFSFFILFSSFLFGQAQYDTLVLVNGSKKAVIIKEIGDKVIKYKIPADSTGPTYVVQTKMIERFILKNGCLDLKEVGYENCVKDPTYGVILNPDFKRVIFSTDLMQLAVIKHFQFNIEYVTKNRKLGIEPYFNLGLRDREFKTDYHRKEITINPVQGGEGYYKYGYGGFNLKIYPYSHKKLTYFMALGAEVGQASCFITKTSYDYSPSYLGWGQPSQTVKITTNTTYHETLYTNLHYNNGCILRVNKHFILQANLGLGVNQFKRIKNAKDDKTSFDFSLKYGLGIMMGVAF